MTRERLAQLSDEDLAHLADVFDVDIDDEGDADRASLEEALFEAMEEARAEQESDDSYPVHYHQRRFENVEDLFGAQGAIVEWGFEFPESYNVTRIELLVRDPAWAFCYWDLSLNDQAKFSRESSFRNFALRLEEMNSEKSAEDLHVMDIPVGITDRSWYLNLVNRETKYVVHLLAISDDHETILASSWPVKVPRGGLSRKLDIMDSFETDALLSLSGIENLGVAEMPDGIPQRILSIKDRWEE